MQINAAALARSAASAGASRHLRPAADSAAVGRRRQRDDLRAQQAVRDRPDLHAEPTRRCSRCASAGRTPRPARIRRRSARRARRRPTASPACRPTRASPAACRRSSSPATRDLGRQATNPQWQYPDGLEPEDQLHLARGRHSLKAGYEFQHIDTEVQDVNPLYGRDSYTGQFTPAGRRRSADNLYNLADFMFGLRSAVRAQQHPRRQDAAEHALRLPAGRLAAERPPHAQPRPALRVRARRSGRRDNMLSNFDPATQYDGRRRRTARSRTDRSSTPTATTSRRASASPGRSTRQDRRPRRLRHQLRALPPRRRRQPAAHQRPAGDQRRGRADRTRRLPTFRPTEAGLPGRPHRSRRTFNPLAANITYMPEDYRSSPVQSWYVSVQRELGRGVLRGRRLRRQPRPTTCCSSRTTTRRRRTTPPARSRCSRAGRSRVRATSPTRSTAASRAYKALPGEVRDGAMHGDSSLLSSLTLSQAKDNGAGSLENPNGNFPAPQDFHNMDADFGLSGYHQPYNSTTSFIWSSCRSAAARRFMGDASAVVRCAARRLADGRHQHASTPASRSTLTYTPDRGLPGLGIQQDFRGANNYRPNVIGDRAGASGRARHHQLVRQAHRGHPDRPEPAVRQRRAQQRRGPASGRWTWRASKRFALPWREGRLEFRVEAFNLLNRTNFRAPNGNRSAAASAPSPSTYDPRQIQLGFKLLF